MTDHKKPQINHAPVQSSSIRTIGYDKEKQELHVTFSDTGRYIYHGVTPDIHEGLMMSASKGQYLHHNVKPGFGFTKQ